jgi:LPXTG-site transpeptidase (sortase) family protein
MQTTSPEFVLTENDIRAFLQEARTPASKAFGKSIALIGGSLIMAVLIFYSLNFAAFQRANATTPIKATPIALVKAPSTPVVTATPEPTPVVPALPNNTVIVNELNISAPVNWDTSFAESVIQEKLKSGVIHLQGTAKPGQVGTVVIFGHSSNFPWVKGDYNTIFATLPSTKIGQEITLQYNNQTYVYKVTKTYEVQPTDMSVLNGDSTNHLRLITCTPVGTSLRRLIVEADQISPSPASNTAFSQTKFTGTIPATQ